MMYISLLNDFNFLLKIKSELILLIIYKIKLQIL